MKREEREGREAEPDRRAERPEHRDRHGGSESERDEEQPAVRVHPAAEEQVPGDVDERAEPEREPGRRDREAVRLDEERAHEDERARPARRTRAALRSTSARRRGTSGPSGARPGRRGRRRRAPSQEQRPRRAAVETGTTSHASRQLDLAEQRRSSGMPTIHASGGPRSVIASTRDFSAGADHSAAAASAAE